LLIDQMVVRNVLNLNAGIWPATAALPRRTIPEVR
jgi:hypothetical protein